MCRRQPSLLPQSSGSGANQELFMVGELSSLERGVDGCTEEQHLSTLAQWAHRAACLQNRLALAMG